MRVTRKRELTVSMGPYETYKFGAEISATHNDLGYSDDDLVGDTADRAMEIHGLLQDFVDKELDKALIQELEDASDLTADKKSFLLRAMRDSRSK